MRFLRQISTRRLLALCAVVVAVAALGTAVAMAAGGSGSTQQQQQQSLAQAIHQALAAPAPAGVTARIQFTNHLLAGTGIGQGSDPLLNGASGRLWASDGHLRIELQSSGGAGDSQIVVNGRDVTIYDATANTAVRTQLPARAGQGHGHGGTVPSVAQIEKSLQSASQHVAISGPQSGSIAGRKSLAVRVSPKRNGGLLGSAELAWDAANGVPLRAAISSKSVSPVLELTATDISYGPVGASTFAVTPPKGTRIVDVPFPSGGRAPRGSVVRGLPAVRAHAGFAVSAPRTLAGMKRTEVRLASAGGRTVVLATYGEGPGGLAVVETRGQGALSGLPLPAVTINGAHGNVLQTALGTVVVFERGGVTYVVAGSVPPATAETAARAL